MAARGGFRRRLRAERIAAGAGNPGRGAAPHRVACISVPVERPLWKDGPSWVLVAEEDRMINPQTQHFQAGRMDARVRSRPVDHTPLVTAPAEVVDIIFDAVGDVTA